MTKWKRRIDSAGRIGGEKFGVLLPETDEHGAFLVAERLRRATPPDLRTGPCPSRSRSAWPATPSTATSSAC